ncbi:MAG: hypothetical protein K2Z81_24475 [Cyanobacteria bacterium]|nr:hypothetical protein [Cyanobacteriota bacterium]
MHGESKIFGVIRECHSALKWLQSEEGIEEKQAPEEHRGNLKQLEKLGIVYKRNGRSLGIRWQRLRKLIERADRHGSVPFEPDDVLKFFAVATPN